jgi:6-pyruvoyltetrahydropterin/6-carboxytetrahydropterin synthase
MSENYRVRVQKERLTFCAAHFITYAGDTCEPLHGHNYRVYAEVTGPLDANQYVIDFIALRDALQAIVDALDHRMLLPTEHPTIDVSEVSGEGIDEVEVRHCLKRWIFPRQDCVLLPVANTTAESLATFITARLRETLEEKLASAHLVEVGVDECDGQWGIYRWQSGK